MAVLRYLIFGFFTTYMMGAATGQRANLTRITWAHAVNNQTYLNESLAGPVDRLEADIVIGKVNGAGPDIPIMAHPPANTSDLSLAKFLSTVDSHNRHLATGAEPKGVKLDFKSITAFQQSSDTIDAILRQPLSYPFWLNADVLPGPGVSLPAAVPVDAAKFLAVAKKLDPNDKTVLSLGWTTGVSIISTYTETHIDAMVKLLKNISKTKEITFPVRAAIIARTPLNVTAVLKTVAQPTTLTVWSPEDEQVDVEKLRAVIFDWGVDRVYIDVPEKLRNRLNLNSTTPSPTPTPTGTAASISVSLLTVLIALAVSLLFTA